MPFLNGEQMREKLEVHLRRIQLENQVAEQIAVSGAPIIKKEHVERRG